MDSTIFREKIVNQDHSPWLTSGQALLTWEASLIRETAIKAPLKRVGGTQLPISKLLYVPLSQLPQVLWAAFSLRYIFLKTSAKFYIRKLPWKHRLLLVPEKSAFCSTMSNTFSKWSVTQESANVFCKGLYNHNVVLLDMQSMVRVQSDMAHIRLVNICGCGIRLGLQFEVYWPFL